VTGIVVVVARPGSGVDVRRAATALADVHAALLPLPEREVATAGDLACAITLHASRAEPPGIVQGPDGWVATSGTPRGADALQHVAAAELEGQFVLARYDRAAGALRVATDAFGCWPLYLAETEDASYLASSALALARFLGRTPDETGMALLLQTGFQLGSICHWSGIDRLPAATELAFTADGVQHHRYWRVATYDDLARLGFDDAVDAVIERLAARFATHLGGEHRLVADLTGGFDTRLLTTLLARGGVRFDTATVGEATSRDVVLAQRVAAAAGWPWTRLVHEDPPAAAVHAALAAADGQLPAVALADVVRIHAAQAQTWSRHLSGGAGEVLSGNAWIHESLRAGRSTRLRVDHLIDMKLLGSDGADLLRPDLVAAVREYLREDTRTSVAAYAGELDTTQLDVLLLRRKAAWDGAFAAATSHVIRNELPFLFQTAATVAFSIDWHHRANRRLVRAVLDRLDRDVAEVETAYGGPAGVQRLRDAPRIAPYYLTAARLAAERLARRAAPRLAAAQARRGAPDPSGPRAALLRELELVPQRMATASLYEPRALAMLLRAPDATPAAAATVDRVVTAELAARATAGG
jgi:hypothetical protein